MKLESETAAGSPFWPKSRRSRRTTQNWHHRTDEQPRTETNDYRADRTVHEKEDIIIPTQGLWIIFEQVLFDQSGFSNGLRKGIVYRSLVFSGERFLIPWECNGMDFDVMGSEPSLAFNSGSSGIETSIVTFVPRSSRVSRWWFHSSFETYVRCKHPKYKHHQA